MKSILIAGAALLALSGGSPAAAEGRMTDCTGQQRLRNEAAARIVFEEMLSRGRFTENENVYHADFVVHGAAGDLDRAADRAAAEGWRSLAPDLNMRVLHLVSDCDHVLVHWRSTGTATGAGNGIVGRGQPVNLPGMTLFRLVGGQIVEEWSIWDNAALLRQLGLAGAGP